MDVVKLRGHHIVDFWSYLMPRDGGSSHEKILADCMRFDRRPAPGQKPGESFEVYTNQIFRSIYEGKVPGIIFVEGFDDICMGPRNDHPKNWCASYNLYICLGKRLMEEDKWYISSQGFEKNLPIRLEDFLDKVRKMTLESIIPPF